MTDEHAAALAAADQQYSLAKEALRSAVDEARRHLTSNNEVEAWALTGASIARQLNLDSKRHQFAGEMLAAAAIQIAQQG